MSETAQQVPSFSWWILALFLQFHLSQHSKAGKDYTRGEALKNWVDSYICLLNSEFAFRVLALAYMCVNLVTDPGLEIRKASVGMLLSPETACIRPHAHTQYRTYCKNQISEFRNKKKTF
jgi:hypothetical protein